MQGRPAGKNAPDARTALLCAFCLCTIVACLSSVAACAASLLMGAALLAWARPAMPAFAARFGAVNFFILFMWLLVPWTTPGTALWQFGPLTATRQGVMLCVIITLKANAILAIFIGLLFHASMTQLAAALHSLRCPEKLVWLFLLMDHNVALLRQEWRHLTDSAKLRGFAARTSLHSYRTMAAMLALLLIAAYDRGQRLHEAILLRGSDWRIPFACPATRSTLNMVAGVCTSLAMAILITINYTLP